MLTIFSGRGDRDCDGLARRDFLKVGTLALGSLVLPDLLRARSAAEGTRFVRDKSVVLLYLSGGASHIETFDPKMTAPSDVRSITGELQTPLPGITFGGTFPQLASLADRMAVVRSFQHSVGDHVAAHVHVLSGGTRKKIDDKAGFSMGSLYTRLRGVNHPQTGMPTFALLTDEEVDGQYANERNRVRAGSEPGSLGPSLAPMEHQVGWEGGNAPAGRVRTPEIENPLAADMRLSLPAGRFEDRMDLLRQIDRINRRIDAKGVMDGVDRFNAQAVELVLGGASRAFDFRDEDPRLVERYDTSRTQIGFKQFRPSTLGKQMLVARRLCEAGAGFVTVHSAGWDMHADGNNPGIATGMEMLGRTVDQAVSAFLEDLASRGLSDRILLVITGDFGRSPRVNKRGGRDHWPRLCTLAFAGGGLRMGQVVGASDRNAEAPSQSPVSTPELMATIMHTMFDVGTLRLDTSVPRELMALIQNAAPIPGLV